MKASMHAGRTTSKGQVYNVNHNDRKFKSEYDTHIDSNKTEQNTYYVFLPDESAKLYRMPDDGMGLKKFEMKFYEKQFAAHLDLQNEKHIKSRHKERIRTIEDVYTNPRTCPQETILQVGKDGEYNDHEKFLKMVKRFCKAYNANFSDNSMIIDCAVHADEVSLHAHIRRVFYVKDEQGNLELAQNKALEQMGYELPKPEQKRSKYNNRLQAFTDEMREFWFDTIENIDKSIKIDREANTSSERHLEKLDYQNVSAEKKLDKKKQELLDLESRCADKTQEIEQLEALQNLAKSHFDQSVPKVKKTIWGKGSIVEDLEPDHIENILKIASNIDKISVMLQKEQDIIEQQKKEQEKRYNAEREQLASYERKLLAERQVFENEKKTFEQEKENCKKTYYNAGYRKGKKETDKDAKERIRELSVEVTRQESRHSMDIMICRNLGINLSKLEEKEINRQQLQRQIQELKEASWDNPQKSKDINLGFDR